MAHENESEYEYLKIYFPKTLKDKLSRMAKADEMRLGPYCRKKLKQIVDEFDKQAEKVEKEKAKKD